MDRNIAPAIRQVEQIDLLPLEKTGISGNWPLYRVNAGQQDLVRIEWVFRLQGAAPIDFLAEYAANSMLRDGTKQRSYSQIAADLDALGSHLGLKVEGHRAFVTLYALNKHLSSVGPLLHDIMTDAAYPEEPFSVYVNNQKQAWAVNRKKVAHEARRVFCESLFGPASRAGFFPDEKDWTGLSREAVVASHHAVYRQAGSYVMAAGKIPDELIAVLEDTVSSLSIAEPAGENVLHTDPKTGPVFAEVKDTVQAAIRIGHRTVNKTHPDYPALSVLNTVLGGYFGSRLMKNIREEKGYTYGIGSGIVSLDECGYFFIATEVGAEVCRPALEEIYRELARLREEAIPGHELDVVRNYMLGSLMRAADGPFAQADLHKNMLHFSLDENYFRNLVHTIRSVTPEELRSLAQKHLDQERMVQVVAGPSGAV